MNKEEITLKVKDSNNGFTISNDINYQTSKVIINEIEITDIETWNKVISKQLELQQENKQLKILIENIKLGVVLNDEQEKLLDKVLGDSNE